MYAYAPNGTRITGTLENCPGEAKILEGTFSLNENELRFQYGGGTTMDYDNQGTVQREGETVFIDEDGDEWLESQLILTEQEIDASEEGLTPGATPHGVSLSHLASPKTELVGSYSIQMPKDGLRAVSSFSLEEKRQLRPIAETLAMLDGNSFFGVERDENNDDTWYEQYLPEAAALVATTSGCNLASFMRAGQPLPEGSPFGFTPLEMYGDERVISLTDSEKRQLFRLSDIEWDVDESDTVEIPAEQSVTGEAKSLSPHLPSSLIVATEANVDGEDIDFCDMLSDRYGYCINSLRHEPLLDLPSSAAAHSDAASPANDDGTSYSVIVTRDTTESCVLEVNASSEDEASLVAIEEARNPNTVWERDDTLNASKELYVTHVEKNS